MKQPTISFPTNSTDKAGSTAPPALLDDATVIISKSHIAQALVDDQQTIVKVKNFEEKIQTLRSSEHSGVNPSRPNNEGVATIQKQSVDSSILPVGARVAEFEISGVVGQGGFGVVYRAWDHALEREVAIKEYLPSSLSTRQDDGSVVPLSERNQETFDAGMRSFFNEARLLAQFDHPSLLKVYRFWQERGTTYMVMPLYKGATLKATLALLAAPVDETWLLSVMDGVTQALAVMHQANCYHRDIAPDNILLLEDTGLPVVLDFGAARRVITDMAQAITVILKPGYAPIEQYAEVPDMSQGAWTDVYALGAVMHVAVCGRPPPPSVARLLNDRYIPLAANAALGERYSQKLLTSIDACLAVRPENRPQSMMELRERLGFGESGVSSSQITKKFSIQENLKSTVGHAPSTKSNKKKMVGLAAAIGCIGIASLLLWRFGISPSSDSVNASAPVVIPTAPSTPIVNPSPPVNRPFDPVQALLALAKPPPGGFEVVATPAKSQVRIGKDKLEFGVRSNHSGFVYVYMLSTGGELYQLFPNQLDKRNQIKAGEPISLPRPSWPMEAGGPAGTNRFTVVVSESERDFAVTGIQYDGVFGQFPAKVVEALEAARAGQGPSSLLGKIVCQPGVSCSDLYGATEFKIIETE